MTRTARSRRSLAVLALPLLALAGACGGGVAGGGGPVSPTAGVPAAPVAAARRSSDDGATTVARPTVDTEVFAVPGDGEPVQVLPARTEFGTPLALVVVDDGVDGWLEVQLPTRPNGSTGWIRATGVERVR